MKPRVENLWLAIGLGAVITSGCAHTSLRPHHAAPPSLPAQIVAEFACPRKQDFGCRIEVTEQTANYVLKRVHLKASDDGTNTDRQIALDFYDLLGKEKPPVVLVLPMSGGGYSIERHFASYFANRGYAAVIVHRDRIPKDQQMIENLNPMIRRMVLDHKRVIDWLETVPDVDAGRVGIFGISLGGIKGAMLAPLDNRIQAAIIGLAGGDLPYILAHSTEPGLTKKREEFLKAKSLTPDQAEAALRKMLTRDPLLYAPYVDPRKVLLVLARYDTVVPIAKGLELKEKMGNPETIMIPAGHYTAVLSIPYIKSQSFDFFEKRFAEVSGELPAKRGGGLTKVQAGRR
jgi:dienelactone hydrolase